MINVIEPTDHNLHQNNIESLLRLFKIYQNFELSPKSQDKTTFIIAEDETRGIYGGAVFFPQKIKELDENLSHLLSILENRTVWCARLCLCTDQDDSFTTLDALEHCENFYVNLYKLLGILGEKKNTNCLPMKLHPKDYHNSLNYGRWSYFSKMPHRKSLSDFVYVLLALPEKRQPQESQTQEQNEGASRCEDFGSLLASNDQNQTDRPVQ